MFPCTVGGRLPAWLIGSTSMVGLGVAICDGSCWCVGGNGIAGIGMGGEKKSSQGVYGDDVAWGMR